MKFKGQPTIEFEEVKGIVKLVESKEDAKKIKPKHIVVADSTIPEYLPELLDAKGIVTASGGLLSHSAILSRESNIPTIIGVERIDEILKDGQEIIMKGNGQLIVKNK